MTKLLQALNGAAVVPAAICMVLLSLYLCRESRRRGLRAMDWFHLPPSMNLVLAMFLFDVGVIFRLGATWAWYFFGEDMVAVESAFAIAIAAITVGVLCKIRALTEPDYGRAPWVASCAATAAAVFLLLLLA